MEIFNSIGEIVLVLNYSATNSMAIDLKSLPSGIYFANVLSDDGVSTNKIVLKRD
ncbi:MAG: T9SS type A sorting domain-containing protein [Bacteroidetes bacterium]|nr:T9SS type A sorting domain-containing protein [Bacteroidota bacterium]